MESARIKELQYFFRAVISAVPQDLKFGGEESLAIIGDNCTIRECVTINRGTIASGQTTLGNNCLIMATAYSA
jgi:UDP-N-acetylglucosamine acyltransferase